jgi:hypothetical protein
VWGVTGECPDDGLLRLTQIGVEDQEKVATLDGNCRDPPCQ